MSEPSQREVEILQELSRFGDSIVKLLAPVMAEPDFPLRVIKLALFMRSRDNRQEQQWEDLALWGRQLAPNDLQCLYLSDSIRHKRVPEWHFSLCADAARNQAFKNALERFVKPGMVVLEIGSGTGLLALMAAQAGADHVYTCEQEPWLAAVAQEIIDQNGYGPKITLIPKKSSELHVGVDMPQKADILLSDLADAHLLGYGVLPILEDARRRLLQPQAKFIPEIITALGVLVGGPNWRRTCRADSVGGFDLSPLNRFSPAELLGPYYQSPAGNFCEPFELFAFDFAQAEAFPAESREVALTANQDGQIEGLLQWIRLDFDEAIFLDNQPPTLSHWSPIFYVFPQPLSVRAGDRVRLHLEHDRRRIFVRPGVDR
jgi:hypothetical protein